MKYDELVEWLGEFGPYQRRVYCLACLPAIVAAIFTMNSVFLLSVPEFRCAIPGLSNDTYESQGEWHQRLINYTLPWTDAIDDDDTTWGTAECSVYKNRNATNHGEPRDQKSNQTESCHRWVYDTTNFDTTFVTQENIVCEDKVFRSHANMIYMCGLLVGSILFGFVSDSFGRKTAFMSSLLLVIVAAISLSFSPNYVVFVVLRCLIGVGNMGTFMCCFVLAMELLGKRWRAEAGVAIQFFWCIGLYILNAVAYAARDWQKQQLILACSCTLFLAVYWFVPESPRWQISKGQIEKARATLEKAAKVNGKELPPGAFDSMENKTETKGKFTDIFVSPLLAFRMFVIFMNWIVATMVYYGLTLNVGSLGGNVYVNFALTSTVETLGIIATIWALPRVGRKRFHCFSMILGGAACLACMIPAIIGESSPIWVILLLSNIGKFGGTSGFATIYVYSAELFPTSLRNSVVGASSMMARLGGIAAPYIADLGILVGGKFGTALPYIVFGAASLVAGIATLTLPETLNVPIPESMEDAINIGKEKPPQPS